LFKKKYRLPKDFLREGRTINSPIYTLKLKENGKMLSRFGFIVSKRIDKRATFRNRIKRKFRNCIEQRIEEIEKGYDFLFILKRGIENSNYCEVLFSQLAKENLLK